MEKELQMVLDRIEKVEEIYKGLSYSKEDLIKCVVESVEKETGKDLSFVKNIGVNQTKESKNSKPKQQGDNPLMFKKKALEDELQANKKALEDEVHKFLISVLTGVK